MAISVDTTSKIYVYVNVHTHVNVTDQGYKPEEEIKSNNTT